MKRHFLLLTLILFSAGAFAQRTGVINGILADSTDQKKLIQYATVSVYKAGDTVLTNYRLSDEKGVFRISSLEPGKYRIVVNAWQYKNYRKDITIDAADPVLNLGAMLLAPKDNSVDEVVILGERPPVIVRKDTIEFNAESFKTLPTAVVEDLLKKLPGVTIGANGAIQVNGKTVSKILVDGKEFFGGDPQIATKNLPANIIDKVQVSDDDEAKRRDPDLIPGNTPQVINLKLKRAIKQGAFGKLYAGGGPDKHIETGGIMSFFRDTTQVSVLAYGNNINKPGFSIGDISRIGGFDRSGYNSMMMTSEGGFALDDISFGGLGNGIQTSYGGGLNLNTLTKGGVKINTRYFYGQNNSVLDQLSNDDQTLGSGHLISKTNLNSRANNGSHTASAKIELKTDSLSTLTIRPGVTISPQTYKSYTTKKLSDGNMQSLSDSWINNHRTADNYRYNLQVNYYKDSKKKGRSFNTTLGLEKSDNLEDAYNSSLTQSYIMGSSFSTDQLRDNNIRNFNINLNTNYAEPISKKLTLSFGLTGTYLNNENMLGTFYKNPLNENYDVVVPSLSETVNQSGIKSNARFTVRWALTKDLNIQPAIVYNRIDLLNQFVNFNDFRQSYNFLFPSVNIRYKALSVSYTPSFQEPDVQYIQPVQNNTDPLYVQNGNPNLLPAKTQRINVNLYKYDAKRALNYNFYLSGSVKDNGIIMSRVIESNGRQTNTPVNADGIRQANSSFNFTKDFKNLKRQFSVTLGGYVNYNEGILLVNNNESRSYNISYTPRASIRLNLNDKFEISQSYNYGVNDSHYDNNYFRDRTVITQSGESEMIIRYIKKLVFETTFRFQMYDQQEAGYNNNVNLWNAGLTYLFMKNDRAQLKLSVNDILKSNVRRSSYITENSIRDSQSNNIGRYGLLTFTYNIQNFGGKVGGKERFFGF